MALLCYNIFIQLKECVMSVKPFMNIGPGNIINRFMQERQWTNMDLSKQTGLPLEEVKRLLSNKESVTIEIAKRLSMVFGNSCDFWLNLQENYNNFYKR